MGMQLTAQWECERCPTNATAPLHAIPEGWMYVTYGELFIDDEESRLDFKMPQARNNRVLCNKCWNYFVSSGFAEAAPESASESQEAPTGNATAEDHIDAEKGEPLPEEGEAALDISADIIPAPVDPPASRGRLDG